MYVHQDAVITRSLAGKGYCVQNACVRFESLKAASRVSIGLSGAP